MDKELLNTVTLCVVSRTEYLLGSYLTHSVTWHRRKLRVETGIVGTLEPVVGTKEIQDQKSRSGIPQLISGTEKTYDIFKLD